MNIAEGDFFRSYALDGLVPTGTDYDNPIGVERTQMVTRDFAAALEIAAEEQGVEIKAIYEGEPTEVFVNVGFVPVGQAEVVLFARKRPDAPIADKRIDTVYSEAEKLLLDK